MGVKTGGDQDQLRVETVGGVGHDLTEDGIIDVEASGSR